jgi:hypothetical protein
MPGLADVCRTASSRCGNAVRRLDTGNAVRRLDTVGGMVVGQRRSRCLTVAAACGTPTLPAHIREFGIPSSHPYK